MRPRRPRISTALSRARESCSLISFSLQCIQGEKLRELAVKQYDEEVRVNAKRGDIYDRNLQPLAVNVTTRSLNAMLSNGLAFICSNMVAYIINIFWVFKPGKHNKIIEIALFYLVSGVSMVIGTGMMGFLIRYYGMQTTYAFAANIVSAVMINYTMRKFYIFKG